MKVISSTPACCSRLVRKDPFNTFCQLKSLASLLKRCRSAGKILLTLQHWALFVLDVTTSGFDFIKGLYRAIPQRTACKAEKDRDAPGQKVGQGTCASWMYRNVTYWGLFKKTDLSQGENEICFVPYHCLRQEMEATDRRGLLQSET